MPLVIVLTILVPPVRGEEPPPGVPADWLSAVQADIEASEYHVSWSGTTGLADLPAAWQAPNRAHGFRTYFTEAGIRVVPRVETQPSWEWGLALRGYGRGGTTSPVYKAPVFPSGNRVDYARGSVGEWYVNDPRGLEQGFTLFEPPEVGAEANGQEVSSEEPIHLALELTGTLDPVFSGDGQAVDFRTGAGANVIHFAQLVVTDARGHALPARMEGFALTPGRGIRIVIDVREAVYPIAVDPLATSPSWTAEGNQTEAYFGYAVATAGDVNGDGISDVVVGAYAFDNGQTDEGRAFVYHGSASGLAASAAWTAESDQASANFGIAVGTAGDVNGDGHADVIVGAYLYDNGQTDEGRAYVYHGTTAGLTTLPVWTAEGDQASAWFGYPVATAGDVNGDGYADVIVGSYGFDNGQADEGRAFVYHGSASGLAASPAWTAESNQASAAFGYSVGTAGDVNGDGCADVIVGAYGYDNGQTEEGRAYVYHGSASGLAASPAWTAESDQEDAYFGVSAGTAGDVNGDGYADVIVGAYYYDNGETDEGRAFVYHGSASGLAASPAWTMESDQVSALLGYSVGTAGDVNGDGYADAIVGAHYCDHGETNEGMAFVYRGSASGLSPSPHWTAEGDQVSSRFGFSVGTAGDVNGDGYADVIVGALGYDNGQTDEGRAFVYHGSGSGLAASAGWTAESDQAGSRLGLNSIGTAGDVNGDGYADVIVGAYRYDNGQPDEGRAYVYHGGPSGLAASPAWTAESDQEYAQFGVAVAGAGDVNGDGYADVVVGANSYDNGDEGEGAAFVYHGSALGLSSAPAWTAEGNNYSAMYGVAVGSAGDVNGDGYSDVIVGANQYENGQDAEGRTFVYHGSAAGLAADAAWTAESNQEYAQLGRSVGTAGDVNGDGYADVIVGAFLYDNGQENEGRAFVYHGSASGLAASAGWTAESDQQDAYFGESVGTAGDVDGDGYADVIVGAYGYENGQTDEGRAFVYHGSASGLATSPAWTAESNQTSGYFGSSVGTAGDVNGDGYADVIVGAPYFDNGEANEGRAFVYHGSASGLATSPSWTAESDQEYANLAEAVGTAGDVNGDGYADVIVGAPYYANGQAEEGRAFVYHGNGGGLAVRPQQRRADDSAPIGDLGWSDSSDAFRLAALGRTPFGRGRVRLESEVKPFRTPFTGAATVLSPAWLDTGTSGAALNDLMSGLAPGTLHHWRVRLRYDASRAPFQQRGRWFTVPRGGWQEADLRTGAPGIGDLVWEDRDGDGIQDAGEPGLVSATVYLFSSGGVFADVTFTDTNGHYHFATTPGASYFVRFVLPAGHVIAPRDQGSDDLKDSDADPVTGDTPVFSPSGTLDEQRWDAGMVPPCYPPDEPIYIYSVRVDGDGNPILDFQDPNQPRQVTGYNVYRSSDPGLPPGDWPLVGSDVADMDEATPNKQWVDQSGDPPPGGIWYYDVTAYNSVCDAEGPR